MQPINLTRLKRVVDHHRLTFGVAGVVVIAAFITFVNMSLYYSGEVYYLDASRPGSVRPTPAQNEQAEQEEKFSNTGDITAETLSEFKKLYTARKEASAKLGTYSDQGLSDLSLRFVELERPAEEPVAQ